MALATPVVLYGVNGGALRALVPGTPVTVATGVLLQLELQSNAGVVACTYTIGGPGTTLDGQSFPANGPSFSIVQQLPITPTTYTVRCSVTDGENVTSTTVTILCTSAGIVVSPAPLNGQALVSNGAGTYMPGGHRTILTCAMANPAGDGTTDDYAKLQSVLDQVPVGSNIEVLLPMSPAPPFTTQTQTCTMYALSEPLVMNDEFNGGGLDSLGNGCRRLRGENRDSVGLMPTWNTGAYENPNWLGPLLIVGCTSDTDFPTFVTDTGMRCLSYTNGVSQGYSINYSEYDTGDLNGLSAFCFETWWNPLSDQPGAFTYELASSHGNISNVENHTAFYLQRQNVGSGAQILATLVTTQGGGTTTTTGSQVMPPTQALTTLAFGSTTAMAAAITAITAWSTGSNWAPATFTGPNPTSGFPWLTLPGIGTLILVSVTDPTHAVVINPGFAGNVAPGTSLPNGTTVGIEGMTTVISAPGHDMTLNSLNHVAVDWDGSHLRLWLNGAQPDSSMTAALSGGTVLQKWFEEFIVGQSRFNVWPSSDGSTFGQSGLTYHQGKNALSDISRYTSSFTPTPANVVCGDGHHKMVIDFATTTPASNGFSARLSIATEWLIGRTDAQHAFRPRTGVVGGLPVWLRYSCSQQPFTQHAEVSDLYFYGNCLRGIEFNASLYSHLHRCNFSGLAQGVHWQNFSYGSSYDDLWFSSCGTTGTGFHHWNILHGHGSQAMTHGDLVVATFCGTAWHLVNTFSDVVIGKCFISGQTQGSFAFVGSSGNVMDNGAVLDDESGSEQYCSYLLGNLDAFVKKGGTFFNQNTGSAAIKIGFCATTDMDCSSFAVTPKPIFSFGFAQNKGIPVKWNGPNALQTTSVVDPINPGPLVIASQEIFGVHTITFPSDANYSVLEFPADAYWREYLVASGTITATRTITWPSNPGKVYVGRNNNAQSVKLATLSGAATVTVTSGTAFKVQDQSTGMVSL